MRKGKDSAIPSYVSNDDKRVFYGQHKEKSDICRSNKGQWDFLVSNYGGKLLSAIVVLGGVDAEGRKKIENRIECLENGGNFGKASRGEIKIVCYDYWFFEYKRVL